MALEQRELSLAEILTGLEFQQMIALAQARVQALIDAQGVYLGHLRQVHEVGEDWVLEDWAQGFVRSVAAEEAGEVEKDGD